MNDTEFYELKAINGKEIITLTIINSRGHFSRSKEYGYPECCALDYICDFQHDRLSACERPSMDNGKDSSYVVCRMCEESMDSSEVHGPLNKEDYPEPWK